jgi:hypothetical protein
MFHILLTGKLLARAFLLWLSGSVEQERFTPSSHSVVSFVISDGANFVHSINKRYHLICSECEQMFAGTRCQ